MDRRESKPRRVKEFRTETFPDEVVVYDERGPEIHILKELAPAVFNLCDGAHSKSEMLDKLQGKVNSIDELDVVLQQLMDKQLVECPELTSASSSRRNFLKKTLLAAGVMIVSIPVPVAASSLSLCNCSTVTTSSGNASASACTSGDPVTLPPCGAGVSGNGTICGAVACFQPALGRCTCFEDDGSCQAAGGTITEKCCQGTDPTNPVCENTMN